LQLKQDKMEKLNILEEKANPLFKRKEIQASLTAQVVPKTQEVIELIAEQFSVPKETIAIKKIISNFGSQTFKILTNIYESEEIRKATEPKHIKGYEKPVEPEKVEEAPVVETPAGTTPSEETKPEEAPATETPKEEAKPEEKTE
jgi:ribosomal protein S24E